MAGFFAPGSETPTPCPHPTANTSTGAQQPCWPRHCPFKPLTASHAQGSSYQPAVRTPGFPGQLAFPRLMKWKLVPGRPGDSRAGG